MDEAKAQVVQDRVQRWVGTRDPERLEEKVRKWVKLAQNKMEAKSEEPISEPS